MIFPHSFGLSRQRIFLAQTQSQLVLAVDQLILNRQILGYGPWCRGGSGLDYGTLASRYTQQFDSKWVEGVNPAEEPLLGTADIQSLADLGNSYEVARKMRAIPIQLSDFIAMALPGVIPALPLAATVMPVSEILKGILRLLG
jgi:hypothetical protein